MGRGTIRSMVVGRAAAAFCLKSWRTYGKQVSVNDARNCARSASARRAFAYGRRPMVGTIARLIIFRVIAGARMIAGRPPRTGGDAGVLPPSYRPGVSPPACRSGMSRLRRTGEPRATVLRCGLAPRSAVFAGFGGSTVVRPGRPPELIRSEAQGGKRARADRWGRRSRIFLCRTNH